MMKPFLGGMAAALVVVALVAATDVARAPVPSPAPVPPSCNMLVHREWLFIYTDGTLHAVNIYDPRRMSVEQVIKVPPPPPPPPTEEKKEKKAEPK